MPKRRQLDISWPMLGLDESQSFAKKPGTTVACNNVRAFDSLTDRGRGAQRPGFSRYSPTTMGNGFQPVKCIDHVAISASLSGAETSAVSRTIKPIAICGDVLYTLLKAYKKLLK